MITNVRLDHSGIGDLLKGPEMRSLVREGAEQVESIYRATVAKRTGRLSRETRVETYIGGTKNDRWCARLIAGAPYAASHEFGTAQQHSANELRAALNAWRGPTS